MWPSNNNNRVWIKWGMRMNTVLWWWVTYRLLRVKLTRLLLLPGQNGSEEDEDGTLLKGIIKHEWRDAAADDDVSFFIHPLVCYQSTPPGSASLGFQGIKEASVRGWLKGFSFIITISGILFHRPWVDVNLVNLFDLILDWYESVNSTPIRT